MRANTGLSLSFSFFYGLLDYIFPFYRRVSDIISALSTRVSSLSLVNEQLNEHSMPNIE